MCPEKGSRFRDHDSTFFDYTNRETICVLPLCEAAAARRLWNHHASQAPAGKLILRLNLTAPVHWKSGASNFHSLANP